MTGPCPKKSPTEIKGRSGPPRPLEFHEATFMGVAKPPATPRSRPSKGISRGHLLRPSETARNSLPYASGNGGGGRIFSVHPWGLRKCQKMGVGRVSGHHPWEGVKRAEMAIFRGHHGGPIHWENRLGKPSFCPPSFRHPPKRAKTLGLDRPLRARKPGGASPFGARDWIRYARENRGQYPLEADPSEGKG
jgi:hypothetical protein